MSGGVAGRRLPDLVKHVHALGNLAKYEKNPAVATRRFELKKTVVDHIDKELAVAECGSPVRAMASVPRSFFNSLSASFLIGLLVEK
jgi:hypothetical protein